MMRAKERRRKRVARFRQGRTERDANPADSKASPEIHADGEAVVNDENARRQFFLLSSDSARDAQPARVQCGREPGLESAAPI